MRYIQHKMVFTQTSRYLFSQANKRWPSHRQKWSYINWFNSTTYKSLQDRCPSNRHSGTVQHSSVHKCRHHRYQQTNRWVGSWRLGYQRSSVSINESNKSIMGRLSNNLRYRKVRSRHFSQFFRQRNPSSRFFKCQAKCVIRQVLFFHYGRQPSCDQSSCLYQSPKVFWSFQ